MNPLPYEKDEYTCKLVLVGETAVGKTCLMQRFIDGFFLENFKATVGIDCKTRSVNVNGKYVKVEVWDTVGQERYRSISQNFYRKTDGIFVVYDVTNMTSFNNCTQWLEEIKEFADKDVELGLIGNKSDLEKRKVSEQEGEKFANEHGMLFFETSAKSRHNIDLAFTSLLHKIDEKRPKMLEVQRTEMKKEPIVAKSCKSSSNHEAVTALRRRSTTRNEQSGTIRLSSTRPNTNNRSRGGSCC